MIQSSKRVADFHATVMSSLLVSFYSNTLCFSHVIPASNFITQVYSDHEHAQKSVALADLIGDRKRTLLRLRRLMTDKHHESCFLIMFFLSKITENEI